MPIRAPIPATSHYYPLKHDVSSFLAVAAVEIANCIGHGECGYEQPPSLGEFLELDGQRSRTMCFPHGFRVLVVEQRGYIFDGQQQSEPRDHAVEIVVLFGLRSHSCV